MFIRFEIPEPDTSRDTLYSYVLFIYNFNTTLADDVRRVRAQVVNNPTILTCFELLS